MCTAGNEQTTYKPSTKVNHTIQTDVTETNTKLMRVSRRDNQA